MANETQDPLKKSPIGALPEEEEPQVAPEELKAVKDLLGQLSRAAKTFKLYLPNNPIYQKTIQEKMPTMLLRLYSQGEP